MGKKFITAALPYVNNQPHLGNIVGSVLGSDIFNRFSKKNGDETIFICGTDEYGTATEMEAMKNNNHPSDIVTRNRIIHKDVYDWMNIKFDYFGHTTCDEHAKIVKEIFLKCYNEGYFEKQTVEQFYCEECSQFLADRFVEGECLLCGYNEARGDQCDSCGKCLKVSDIKHPKCSICRSNPSMKSSDHLFLRLDMLQEQIKISMNVKIDSWTENAKNIYKEWLNKDLISRCMTRSLKYRWGVDVPLQGFKDKVFYVWFDAVLGYFTFLSIIKPDWKEWLLDAKIIQFMGKDNVFFHSFILPAILIASKNTNFLVDCINSTEYLTFDGRKFSKSRKIGVFGLDLLEKDLGPSCLWRFYLTRKRPETKDADFNITEFKDLYNADLRSNLGNLCQRVLKFLNSRCNGRVNVENVDEDDQKFISEIDQLYKEYLSLMSNISLRDGIAKGFEISSRANKYIQDLQQNKEKMPTGFSIVFSVIVLLGHVFEPFMPNTSEKIFKMCQVEHILLLPKKFELLKSGQISKGIQILFNPLTDLQISNLDFYSS